MFNPSKLWGSLQDSRERGRGLAGTGTGTHGNGTDMKNGEIEESRKGGRFNKKEDGEMIRKAVPLAVMALLCFSGWRF